MALQPFESDFIFHQAAAISKSHAYDIVVEQVKDLKKIIADLIEAGDLNDLEFTDQESTDNFKAILWKAKLLSL